MIFDRNILYYAILYCIKLCYNLSIRPASATPTPAPRADGAAAGWGAPSRRASAAPRVATYLYYISMLYCMLVYSIVCYVIL